MSLIQALMFDHLDVYAGSVQTRLRLNFEAFAGGTFKSPLQDISNNTIDRVEICLLLEKLQVSHVYAILRDIRRCLKEGGEVRLFYLSQAHVFLDKELFVKQLKAHLSADIAEKWKSLAWSGSAGELIARLLSDRLVISFFSEEFLLDIAKFSGLRAHPNFSSALTGAEEGPFIQGLRLEKPFRAEIPSNPLVSVCIPAHKHTFLTQTLRSVQQQDYANLEVLVSDDSNNDSIAKIVKSFDDQRIRYLVPPVKDAHINHIFPVREARGFFVKFCNDDDLLEKNSVSALVELASRYPAALLVTSARREIDAYDNLLPVSQKVFSRMSAYPVKIDGQYAASLAIRLGNFIGEPNCTLFRKSDFDLFGDRIFHICESNTPHTQGTPGDLQLWFNFLSRGDLLYTPEVLSYLRRHQGSISFGNRSSRDKSRVGWRRFVDCATRYGFDVDCASRLEALTVD
jgi:glycosyltransferase involved in cell wall biosynthesis